MAERRFYDDDDDDLYFQASGRGGTLRRVQRVSRSAALTTKNVIWDNNNLGIDAAVAAVDQWESVYNLLRGLVVTGVRSIEGLYGAAKEGAGKIEHGVLVPVRDWIILPAFVGAERATGETIKFLQSEQAKQLASQSLEVVKTMPFGENLLAPGLVFSVMFCQRSWDIIQYPIPSRHQVRDSVDIALNGTKWALSTAGREVVLFVKRADANITRTLSHTQWKVLGSGPYATLDKLNKREVIDHLCERYFGLDEPLARYELAAHIKRHNAPLYHDLVLTGILKERGGPRTEDDEWLSTYPVYRHLDSPFLIPEDDSDFDDEVLPLWFRLPYVNGKRPGRDTPWVCFRYKEQGFLEDRYKHVVRQGQTPAHGAIEEIELVGEEDADETLIMSNATSEERRHKYPTIAKWYVPDSSSDVLVDQQRHAVSFFLCCPKCQKQHEPTVPPLAQKGFGDLCATCGKANDETPYVSTLLAPPPVGAVMRPIFWRFHGPGDEVRRATWLLDTPRSGLQPFDDAAQAVLEDAYLFLKWMSARQEFDTEMDGALLTVEVVCPDGTERLVQFGSLNQATAIQKGVFSAVSLFKHRVYRGAWLQKELSQQEVDDDHEEAIQRALQNSIATNGTLGDTLVPDATLRSVLSPPREEDERRAVMFSDKDDLAVPPARLWNRDMEVFLEDQIDNQVDHLCLVVHGIGEMMRSVDVFGLSLPHLSSIIDCCGYLRRNHAEVQEAHFSQMYPTATATTRASTGRVEYLPVEWHEAFSIVSQRRKANCSSPDTDENVMIQDISLRTIPNLRDFANDTLMDVLYFMSPDHHDTIVSIVCHEMSTLVEKFRTLTGFKGRVSLIGHSLGSIIAWDILGNQNPDTLLVESMEQIAAADSLDEVASFTTASEGDAEVEAPEVTQPAALSTSAAMYPKLDFEVDNLFLLGSPVAVFLMIRNQRKPLSDDHSLSGCSRVFNIFHPFDPIAYRLEPCIDPRNSVFEPSIMKHWNGGFRVQYQTKRLWRRIVNSTLETQQNVVEAFEASMAKMGLIDSTTTVKNETAMDDVSIISDSSTNEPQLTRVATGRLNQGRRIDYSLQEREIENANEYLAAMAAHSSYWTEKDLSLFVARQIYLSTMEQAAVDAVRAEAAAWENLTEAT